MFDVLPRLNRQRWADKEYAPWLRAVAATVTRLRLVVAVFFLAVPLVAEAQSGMRRAEQ